MPQSQKNGKTQVASPACWAIAFSSEVGTGAHKENATKQKARASVLIAEGFPAIPGVGIIAEYLDEVHGGGADERRLLPVSMGERIEVRRLMAWFNDKFF